MQERYLGDIHDHFKFIFLKFLSKSLKQKIGLNWYLVKPSSIGVNEIFKKDGEKRNITPEITSKIDGDLIKELSFLKNPINRNINTFSRKTHLRKFIKFFNKEINVGNRDEWFKQSLNFFRNQDIIFLDPDNGIKKSVNNQKQSLKYAFRYEIEYYIKQNKTIIFTQFQSFNSHHLELVQKIYYMFQEINIKLEYPIIRNRSAPNTFFFTISDVKKDNIKEIYENYSKFNKKVELIYT